MPENPYVLSSREALTLDQGLVFFKELLLFFIRRFFPVSRDCILTARVKGFVRSRKRQQKASRALSTFEWAVILDFTSGTLARRGSSSMRSCREFLCETQITGAARTGHAHVRCRRSERCSSRWNRWSTTDAAEFIVDD